MPTERPSEANLSPEITSLFEEIRAAGFPLVGAVDLALAKLAFREHSARYEDWIRRGLHGEMSYLERGLPRRLDPTLVLHEAKSVITCAIPYRRNPEKSLEPDAPLYARYLEGPDYHQYLPGLLEDAFKKWGVTSKWKICVDTSAVLERSWAALAGLGWIGKNTLLIHPQLGSYLFIATILLDRETGLGPQPLPNYCGNCRACLDGCPTGAFVRAGTLDARKCISYLTLEKRGAWVEVPEKLERKMGTWIAGCDICQEVCPYNLKPLRLAETWPSDTRDHALIRDWSLLEVETEASYRARIQNSSLSRIKYPEMKRNILKARRNNGQSPNSNP